MGGRVIFPIRFHFNDLADELFAMVHADEVFTEKVFGHLKGGAKVETAGELVHDLVGYGKNNATETQSARSTVEQKT